MLSVLVDSSLVSRKFLRDVVRRQRESSLPFFDLSVREFSFKDQHKVLYLMCFYWKILRPCWIAVIPFLIALLFGSMIALCVGVGVLSLEFLLSEFFVYFIFRLGLKKGGFVGCAKYVSSEQALQMICENGTR